MACHDVNIGRSKKGTESLPPVPAAPDGYYGGYPLDDDFNTPLEERLTEYRVGSLGIEERIETARYI